MPDGSSEISLPPPTGQPQQQPGKIHKSSSLVVLRNDCAGFQVQPFLHPDDIFVIQT